jgi:hypothetical protein
VDVIHLLFNNMETPPLLTIANSGYSFINYWTKSKVVFMNRKKLKRAYLAAKKERQAERQACLSVAGFTPSFFPVFPSFHGWRNWKKTD